MALIEAAIYARPNHVLKTWQVRESDDRYFVSGLDYRRGDPLASSIIRFFDSERCLMLDDDGQVWLLSDRDFYYPGYWDCTQEIVKLIAQPLNRRVVPPLTAKEQALYKQLTSKK